MLAACPKRVVAPHRRGVTVSEQVRRDHGVLLREPQGDRFPVPRGVDHPVYQHDRRAAPGDPVDHPMAMQLRLPCLEHVAAP